jgi:hypothetical protein
MVINLLQNFVRPNVPRNVLILVRMLTGIFLKTNQTNLAPGFLSKVNATTRMIKTAKDLPQNSARLNVQRNVWRTTPTLARMLMATFSETSQTKLAHGFSRTVNATRRIKITAIDLSQNFVRPGVYQVATRRILLHRWRQRLLISVGIVKRIALETIQTNLARGFLKGIIVTRWTKIMVINLPESFVRLSV